MLKINTVSVDETRYFNFAECDREFIRGVRVVYAYNPEEHVYCCELTPSYELHYLYTYLLLVDGVDDEVADRLDETYCYEPIEDEYMHCSGVERLKPLPSGEYETLDEAIEYLRGNPPQ